MGEVRDVFAEFVHGFAGCCFNGDGFGGAAGRAVAGVVLVHVSWFVLCC